MRALAALMSMMCFGSAWGGQGTIMVFPAETVAEGGTDLIIKKLKKDHFEEVKTSDVAELDGELVVELKVNGDKAVEGQTEDGLRVLVVPK